MKTNLLPLLAALLLAACADSGSTVAVDARLADVPDSTRVYLMIRDGQVYRTVADTLVIGGRARFDYAPDSTALLPAEFSLDCEAPVSGSLRFWAGRGRTRIEGRGVMAADWRAENRTAEQAAFVRLNPRTDAARERDRVYAEYLELVMPVFRGEKKFDDALRARANALLARSDSLFVVYLGECYAVVRDCERFTDFELAQVAETVRFAFMNGRTVLEPFRARLEAQYAALTPEQQASAAGETFRNALWPVVALVEGDRLPEDPLRDLEGEEHRMSDFRGRYVLLDFWSCGCGPCIAAMGELGELARTYADRLVVVSVSVDESTELWRKASEQHGVSWTNLSDGKGQHRGFACRFAFTGIPFYVLADPEGVIVDRWSGYGEGSLRSRVGEALK